MTTPSPSATTTVSTPLRVRIFRGVYLTLGLLVLLMAARGGLGGLVIGGILFLPTAVPVAAAVESWNASLRHPHGSRQRQRLRLLAFGSASLLVADAIWIAVVVHFFMTFRIE